jgi:hypothetical protein
MTTARVQPPSPVIQRARVMESGTLTHDGDQVVVGKGE